MKSIYAVILISFLLIISSLSFITIAKAQGGYYCIQTTSPQYSIVPGSVFIQPLNSSYQLYIAILLNFTNYGSLQSYLYNIYNTPNNFHKWLTPNQFDKDYYPSSSYVHNLIKYLTSYNLQYDGQYGLVLVFNGTVGNIEQAFNTYINIYYYPFTNLYWFGLPGITNIGPFYYYANNVTASLPYNVGKHVLGIVGLDSIDPKIIPAIEESWQINITKPSSDSLVSPVIISPNTIQQYFNFTEAYSHGYNGNGSTIAIEGVPECFVNTSDIYAFWELYHIPRTGHLSVIYFGTDTSGGQSAENELDAEWSGAFAPASNITIVFSDGYVGGYPLVGNLLNYWYELYYMVNYLDPTEISISVALPESFLAAYYPAMLDMIHNTMMQAAAEGISVLAASGDWGFESDYPPPNFIIGTYNTIWYPESDPFVTAVGGIFLDATSNGSIESISGWDYSTGGISVVFPVQSYEFTSLIPFTPVIARTYPDIAFVSAGGYNIPEYGFGLPLIFQGQLFVWYGTSGAAPMTAAMVALSSARLGALNFALYHISYQGLIISPIGIFQGFPAWIPISSGNNPTPAHYGWNFVTGPGTYNAYNMVRDLLIYSGEY
ncbi:S53 family peptidase [Acidianus manzaensis]|uniref:Peptidase S53 n=1 Tax=Acidianus manzaensis TaxID=282676 RepID=A0A1W6JZ83_9CREN|nr:protease pro-enzyme activation domain-containing protein [Acidianus manzaensis]ARM75568.1 peptidase S53 [Acidianus manzaensis]